MPIHVSWGNPEKTYTVFTFDGKWTWEDYHQSIRDGYQLVKDCSYTVNILLDVSNCNLFPQNLLSHFGSSMRQPPKQFDLAVVLTSSRFVETLAGMINRLYGKKTRFKVARSMEEAQRMFVAQDAKAQGVPVPAAIPEPAQVGAKSAAAPSSPAVAKPPAPVAVQKPVAATPPPAPAEPPLCQSLSPRLHRQRPPRPHRRHLHLRHHQRPPQSKNLPLQTSPPPAPPPAPAAAEPPAEIPAKPPTAPPAAPSES